MSGKIREDLDGVVTVHVAGVATTLHPGDVVPDGVRVDEALLESSVSRETEAGGAGAGTSASPAPVSPAPSSGPATPGPAVAAVEVPEGDVDTVLAHLEAHPDEVAGILAAEAAGKGRVGILQSKFAT